MHSCSGAIRSGSWTAASTPGDELVSCKEGQHEELSPLLGF